MTKDLLKDFVEERSVPLEVKGYDTGDWMYKPTTAGDENDWSSEYIVIKDGRAQQDFGLLNKCKFKNITKVPYTREHIKQIIFVDDEWGQLSDKQKWMLIRKLNPEVFSNVIDAMTRVDNPNFRSPSKTNSEQSQEGAEGQNSQEQKALNSSNTKPGNTESAQESSKSVS